MEKREILLQLIQHYASGNKTQFAKIIGLTPQALGNMLARNKLDVEKVLTNCVNVNPTFLLTGEGSITLESGTPKSNVYPQALNANFDNRLNELLTISSNLYEMFKAVNERMTEATAIITKSQEQFDRVLTAFENNNKKTGYMVAEN